MTDLQERVVAAMMTATNGWDSFTQDTLRRILPEQAQAAIDTILEELQSERVIAIVDEAIVLTPLPRGYITDEREASARAAIAAACNALKN